MKSLAIAIALVLVPFHAFAAKPCEDLKTEIAAKLDTKGVEGYTLDIVASDQVGEQRVVGSCDGGTNKIVYARGTGVSTAAPAAPSSTEPAAPAQ